MSKRNKKSEYEPMREMLLQQRDELNRRIEQRRQEIVADQDPEDEVGLALRNSSTGMAIVTIEREVRTLVDVLYTMNNRNPAKTATRYLTSSVLTDHNLVVAIRLTAPAAPA